MSTNSLPIIEADQNTLVKLTKAHEAFEKVIAAEQQEVDKAVADVQAKHHYFVRMSQSVLYEAMAAAAYAGFSYEEMVIVMNCEAH